MGNLHEGHLRLIDEARQRADKVVCSIFVNPMQFGANEDLDKYPRTLAADQAALRQRQTDLLFTPEVDTMYPRGLDQQSYIEVPGVSDGLCGASRPGHFRGVATVVCKLFNLVQPDIACFGKKDYQQLLVIRTMASDLCLPIDIIGVDTVREPSGLAMSSRNNYLSPAQKQQAATLYRTLQWLAEQLQQGNRDIAALCRQGRDKLSQAGFEPDYLEVRRQQDLRPARASDCQLVILAAAFLGTTRLIDNLEVTLPAS